MDAEEFVSLSDLEAELGISRVDLLLMIRRLGLEPIRRGMRTFLSHQDGSLLISRITADDGESVAAELVLEDSPVSQLPVPMEPQWFKADLYAELRLFRERLEILERLVRSGIEIDSRELSDLLKLKRLPAVEQNEQGAYFDRLGLRFWRRNRAGQRLSWRVSAGTES